MRLLMALLLIAAVAGLVSATTGVHLRIVAKVTVKLVARGWFVLGGIGGLMPPNKFAFCPPNMFL